MVIIDNDTPTEGYLTKFEKADIFPLTFKELLKYIGDEQMNKTREYLRALEYMIQRSPSLDLASILDADYLIYLFKSISTSKSAEFTVSVKCSHCGNIHTNVIKTSNISYSPIDKKNMSLTQVELGGRQVPIIFRTIGDFIKFAYKVLSVSPELSIEELRLISLLGVSIKDAVTLVTEATTDDISTISYLDNTLFSSMNSIIILCTEEKHKDKRGTTASVSLSAVDIFRDIVQLNRIEQHKLQFGEVRETE